jgi:hypothetical protein
MFRGFELGHQIGKDMSAVLEDRRQRQEYTEVAAEVQKELAAIDNEMVLAKNVLEAEQEKMRKGEFVSQKDFGSALYGATMGQVNLMNKKGDILSNRILKYGTNAYVQKNLGAAMSDLLERQNQAVEQMEAGVQALSTAASTDIAAYRAETGRQETTAEIEQGKQRIELEGRRVTTGERAQATTARQGQQRIDLAAEAGEREERRIGIAEEGLDLQKRELDLRASWKDRELNVSEQRVQNMSQVQALEQVGILSTLANEWNIRGRDLNDLAKLVSTEDRKLTGEDLNRMVGDYTQYGKELRIELQETDRRIKALTAEAKAGDEGAIKALGVEQRHKHWLIASDRAQRTVMDETMHLKTLEGLDATAVSWGRSYAGAVNFMEQLAYVVQPMEFGRKLVAGMEKGYAAEQAGPAGERAAKTVYGE